SAKFKEHLDSCPDCLSLYQKLSKSFDLLKPKAEIVNQPFYFTRLKQNMENMHVPRESIIKIVLSRKVFQPIIYLASLVIAVYIGILVGSSSTEPNQFSESNNNDVIDYLQTFAEYQYLNDFETEPIENLIIEDEDSE
ncbi:hypothetical protein ACFLS4_04790, partial [Bacteroidota bacterium]